jgi:hypothetical protein
MRRVEVTEDPHGANLALLPFWCSDKGGLLTSKHKVPKKVDHTLAQLPD